MKIKRKQLVRKWTRGNIDDQLQMLVEDGAVSPVAWWLMASYAYYKMGRPFLKDETYDWLGHWLKDNWDSIVHINKHLIHQDGTFTGFYIRKYPTRVQNATWQLLKILQGGRV